MDLNHVHLGVDDVDESAVFYERFGFRKDVWHGGALFLRNDDGFDLALGPHGRAAMPEWFHIGFRMPSADDVRALQATCAPVRASGDDPDFVWFRVTDPDGYEVEVYWEE